MKTCVIFCAGTFGGLAEPIGQGDVCIAADGGLKYLQDLDIAPDVILGDFDSLGYVPQNATVFPVEKDDTDAMLAARRGLELGCHRFVFYGALEGPRLDHTVANFQTLQFLVDRGAQGFLVGRDSIVTVIKNGSLTLPALPDGIVSVFCMGSDARGVTIRGLQYELEQGTLTPGFPLGVSNHFVGKEAEISVEDGSLLILYPREAMKR
jgi:thiamine pyrophosphokinase